MICNRNRTARHLDNYQDILKTLDNPYFVTLTIPNVSADDLRPAINRMYRDFVRLKDSMRKNGIKLKGIRKLECTYNPERNDFHPHFHFVFEGGQDVADEIIDYWLSYDKNRSWKAQDCRPADEGSIKELFKYFTKILSNSSKSDAISITGLDVIFQSIQGKRVFQPVGIKQIKRNRSNYEYPEPTPEYFFIEKLKNDVKIEEIREKEDFETMMYQQYPSNLYVWHDKAANWYDYDGLPQNSYSQTHALRIFQQKFTYENVAQTVDQHRTDVGWYPPPDS